MLLKELAMALNKARIGDLLELVFIRNKDLLYGEKDAIGVNIEKTILPMRGDISGKDFEKFFVVPPRHFVFNPRGSRKLGLGFNNTDKTYIVTFNDYVFKVKDDAKSLLLEEYLFMYMSRKEFDRKAEYMSWGSSTEVFEWSYFCEETIDLPSIDVQRKYVKIYNSLLSNLKCFENGLDDLKRVCDSYIENLRRMNKTKLEGHLIESNERNEGLVAKTEKGVSIQKVFIDTKAKSSEVEKQKLVKTGYFAFNSNTSRNSDTISIALNNDEPCAVSNTYIVFKCDETIMPEYLYLWFKRKEFDRFARFNSWGSARETLSLNEISEYEISIPSIDVQKSVVELLRVYDARVRYRDELKAIISNICPILIRGAISEAKGGNPNAN